MLPFTTVSANNHSFSSYFQVHWKCMEMYLQPIDKGWTLANNRLISLKIDLPLANCSFKQTCDTKLLTAVTSRFATLTTANTKITWRCSITWLIQNFSRYLLHIRCHSENIFRNMYKFFYNVYIFFTFLYIKHNSLMKEDKNNIKYSVLKIKVKKKSVSLEPDLLVVAVVKVAKRDVTAVRSLVYSRLLKPGPRISRVRLDRDNWYYQFHYIFECNIIIQCKI